MPSVPVTRALLPDRSEYQACLDAIFDSRHLTNHGKHVHLLEERIALSLGVPHVAACSNGTLALQLGLHVARLAGKEVITTPFSYVATLSALLWEGCRVIFADVDEDTLCLDPKSVAERITPDTAGIVPVHIYGNPCDVEALDQIASSKGLTVLYDAAQAYGTLYKGRSIFTYGDYATCSLHATKIFHTVEGGFFVSHSDADDETFRLLRACGHMGDTHKCLGINAKLSELHAAMGLCLIDKVVDNIKGRGRIIQLYDQMLPRKGLRRPLLREETVHNNGYYPVIFEEESIAERILTKLAIKKIYPRRYFTPALNTLPYLKPYIKGIIHSCPNAESAAKRTLCLPLYTDMENNTIEQIVSAVEICINEG
jgi:dTDP-4-amino-4,6-dideoxygalactose transaminase